MAFIVTIIPGKQFGPNEDLTIPSINLLGNPTVSVSGSIGGSELADGAITAGKVTPDAYAYVLTTWAVVNEYLGAWAPAPSSLVDGTELNFRAHAECTGPAKLNPNGLGLYEIFKWKDMPLGAGDIKAGQVVKVRFRDDADPLLRHFQMLSQTGIPPWRPDMRGASDYNDGIGGSVPAPTAGQQLYYLAGDGTFKDLNATVATLAAALQADIDYFNFLNFR